MGESIKLVPQINPENAKDRLKEEFLKPFEESKVIQLYGQSQEVVDARVSDGLKLFEIYMQTFEGYEYRILRGATEDEETYELFFILTQKGKVAPETELVFRSHVSKTAGKGYNMMHRIAGSSQDGISGTSFLRKAEEYIVVLKSAGLIECNYLFAETYQPKVTEWLLKNNYDYAHDDYRVIPESFTSENSREIVLEFPDNVAQRDSTLVKKEAFDDQDFAKYIREEKGKTIWSGPKPVFDQFCEKYFPFVTVAKRL